MDQAGLIAYLRKDACPYNTTFQCTDWRKSHIMSCRGILVTTTIRNKVEVTK